MASVFVCKQCGQCCEGRGGIVLSSHDIQRLAAYLHQSCEQIVELYTEYIAGKARLKIGSNGYCHFYDAEKGCSIHEAKPDVCKAWPFFRGNLIDPVSLELAKEYCPGITKNADYETFLAEGLEYIKKENLARVHAKDTPNALKFSG